MSSWPAWFMSPPLLVERFFEQVHVLARMDEFATDLIDESLLNHLRSRLDEVPESKELQVRTSWDHRVERGGSNACEPSLQRLVLLGRVLGLGQQVQVDDGVPVLAILEEAP